MCHLPDFTQCSWCLPGFADKQLHCLSSANPAQQAPAGAGFSQCHRSDVCGQQHNNPRMRPISFGSTALLQRWNHSLGRTEQTDHPSSAQSMEGAENGPGLSYRTCPAGYTEALCPQPRGAGRLRSAFIFRREPRLRSVPDQAGSPHRSYKAKRFRALLRAVQLHERVKTERKLRGKHPDAEQRKETDSTGGRAARPQHGEVSGEQSEALLPPPRGSGGAAAPGAAQEAAASPRPAGTSSPAGRRRAAALTWHRGRGAAPRPPSFPPPVLTARGPGRKHKGCALRGPVAPLGRGRGPPPAPRPRAAAERRTGDRPPAPGITANGGSPLGTHSPRVAASAARPGPAETLLPRRPPLPTWRPPPPAPSAPADPAPAPGAAPRRAGGAQAPPLPPPARPATPRRPRVLLGRVGTRGPRGAFDRSGERPPR